MQSVFNNLSTSLGSNIVLNAPVQDHDSFYGLHEDLLLLGEELVRVATTSGGRLVPASQFEGTDNQVALRDALLSSKATVTYPTTNTTDLDMVKYGAPFVVLVVGPNKCTVSAANDTSSITPAWRKSLWNVVANLLFSNQASTDETQHAYQGANEATELLRSVMPERLVLE